MKTKYLRYTLQGEFSADEALHALGAAGSQGTILRFENSRGQTHLYLAAHEAAFAKGKKKETTTGKVKVKEVSGLDVTKIA